MCSSITRPYFRVGTYINSLKNCHVLHTKCTKNPKFHYVLLYFPPKSIPWFMLKYIPKHSLLGMGAVE